jgi:hypothetical protein
MTDQPATRRARAGLSVCRGTIARRRKETAMPLSWPNHPITLEEWEALPEDSEYDLEVAEGMLVLSPGPLSWHQKAGMRLGTYELTGEHTGSVALDVAGHPVVIDLPALTRR